MTTRSRPGTASARRRRVAAAVAALALASGCSLVTSFDGLSGGTGSLEGGAQDGGADESSDVDARSFTEAAAADGGDGGDGGGAPSTRCMRGPDRFCEDFDDDAGFGCALLVGPGAESQLRVVDPHSAPRALGLSFLGTSPSQSVACAAPRGILGSARRARIAFWVRFQKQLAGDRLRVVTIYPNADDETGRLVMLTDGASVEPSFDVTYVDGGQGYAVPSALNGPLGAYGAWHQIALELDYDAKTITLVIDGLRGTPANVSNVRFGPDANPRVVFGTDYSPSIPAGYSYELDDLVIEPLPD